MPLGIALAAALQAGVAAALVRRFVAPAADADPAARRRRLPRRLRGGSVVGASLATLRSCAPALVAAAKALADLGEPGGSATSPAC